MYFSLLSISLLSAFNAATSILAHPARGNATVAARAAAPSDMVNPVTPIPSLPQTQGTQFGAAAGVKVTVYDQTGCPHGKFSTFQVSYGTNYVTDVVSYSLDRDLNLGEQLDWSTTTPNAGSINGVAARCTLFSETTNPDSNGNMLHKNQCYEVDKGKANCFNLWHH